MNRFCAVATMCTLMGFVCSSDSKTPDVPVGNILPNLPPQFEQNQRGLYILPFRGSGQGFPRREDPFRVFQFNMKPGVPTTFYCTERVCVRADQWPCI